jgi:dUTP pyrophosphatase
MFSFSRVHENAKLPIKGSPGSAGYDLYSAESSTLGPGKRKLICTGLKLESCQSDMYLRIAPRSSLAVKGIDVGAGVVDCDYVGKLKILIINASDTDYEVKAGDRIAQMIPTLIKENSFCFIIGEENSTNSEFLVEKRGEGGFGSTGLNSA